MQDKLVKPKTPRRIREWRVSHTSLLAITLLVVVGVTTLSDGDRSARVQAQQESGTNIVPEDNDDAARDFLKHYATWLEQKLKKVAESAHVASSQERLMPPSLFRTKGLRKNVQRRSFWLTKTEGGKLYGQEGTWIIGLGFQYLSHETELELKHFDPASVTSFYSSLYELSDKHGNLDLAPKLAALLYENDSKWAGNRVMRRYHDMLSHSPDAQEVVIEYVRKMHDWPEDAAVVTVDYGNAGKERHKRREFALKDPVSADNDVEEKRIEAAKKRHKKADSEEDFGDSASERRAAWEFWLSREFDYLAGLTRRYNQWCTSLGYAQLPSVGRTLKAEDYQAFSWSQLEHRWSELIMYAGGSRTLERLEAELKAAQAIKRERKRKIALVASAMYWRNHCSEQNEAVADIRKKAQKHFEKGEELNKADIGKGKTESFEHYEKALEELLKVVPDATPNAKASKCLDPANLHAYKQMAEIYLKACRPVHGTLDKVSDTNYVKAAKLLLERCLEAYPGNEGVRLSLGQTHLFLAEYDEAKSYFNKLIEENGKAKTAAQAGLDRVEKAIRQRG